MNNVVEGEPIVIFEIEELKKKVNYWLDKNKISMSFNMMLLNLGFKKTDIIYLSDCGRGSLSLLKDVTFRYTLNELPEFKDYKITLGNGINFDVRPSVTLETINGKRKYECLCEENNIRFNLVYYSIFDDSCDLIYHRYLSNESACFLIEKGDYTLKIEVVRPNCLEASQLDYSKYSNFELRNEGELFQYLMHLQFQPSVIRVYNEICKISLGDIKKYPDFSLKVTEYNNRNRHDETLDLLHFKNGDLEECIVTKDGFTLHLDKCDIFDFQSKVTKKKSSNSAFIIPFRMPYNIGDSDLSSLETEKSKEGAKIRKLELKHFNGENND